MLLGIGFLAVDEDLPLGCRHELGNAVQEGGLATSCGANYGQKLAFPDVEVDAVENGQIAKTLCEIIHNYLGASLRVCKHVLLLNPVCNSS